MPRPLLRRPLTVVAVGGLSLVMLALSPLLVALGELVAALSGDRRLAIMARLLTVYAARELATLLACGALWVLGGAGRLIGSRKFQAAHWGLLRWFVGGIAAATRQTLGVHVRADAGSEPAARALAGETPLLVFSRHAGPADTILLIGRLMGEFARRPSVVFKESVALDPAIDLLSHRLPHAVLDTSDGDACRAQIVETTRRLGPRGVLLLYPEGGNFTPARQERALRSLRRRGRRAAARTAERLEHMLPPQPAGTLAALEARPDADVVFAAHTGLGIAAYPLQIWRDLPVGRTLHTRLWLVARSEIPDGEDDRCAWLNEWWERIDRWVDERGGQAAQTATGAGA